jgi:hypothetical protein
LKKINKHLEIQLEEVIYFEIKLFTVKAIPFIKALQTVNRRKEKLKILADIYEEEIKKLDDRIKNLHVKNFNLVRSIGEILNLEDWLCTKCLSRNRHHFKTCIHCNVIRGLPKLKPAFNFLNVSLELQNPLFSLMPKNYIFGSTVSTDASTISQLSSESIQSNMVNQEVKNNQNTTNNRSIAPSLVLSSNTPAQVQNNQIMRPETIPIYKKVSTHGSSNVESRVIFSHCVPLPSELDVNPSNSRNEIYSSYTNNSINNPNNTIAITSTTILPRRSQIQEAIETQVLTRNSSVYDNLSVSNIFNNTTDINSHDSSISSLSSNNNNNSASITESTLTIQTSSRPQAQGRGKKSLESRSLFRTLKETFSYSISTLSKVALISLIFFFFLIMLFYIFFLYISSNYNV